MTLVAARVSRTYVHFGGNYSQANKPMDIYITHSLHWIVIEIQRRMIRCRRCRYRCRCHCHCNCHCRRRRHRYCYRTSTQTSIHHRKYDSIQWHTTKPNSLPAFACVALHMLCQFFFLITLLPFTFISIALFHLRIVISFYLVHIYKNILVSRELVVFSIFALELVPVFCRLQFVFIHLTNRPIEKAVCSKRGNIHY